MRRVHDMAPALHVAQTGPIGPTSAAVPTDILAPSGGGFQTYHRNTLISHYMQRVDGRHFAVISLWHTYCYLCLAGRVHHRMGPVSAYIVQSLNYDKKDGS